MKEVKLLKVVNYKRTYKDKEGNERPTTNYYISVNNRWICIKPTFSKDYEKLELLAEIKITGKDNE